MTKNIQVSILGDNEIVREGLRRILTEKSFNVTSVESDPEALSITSDETSDHVIILDAESETEGLEASRILRERFPESRLVLLANDYQIDSIVRAFDAGVDGYLMKAISCEPLAGALKLVALGEKVFPTQMVDCLSSMYFQPAHGDWRVNGKSVNLSDREIEILRCLVRGEANKVIGRRLDITEATVKVHIKAILRKLRVTNRTQAAIWALSRGLSDEEESTSVREATDRGNGASLPVASSCT